MSKLQVDTVAESTSGAGVTVQGLKAPGGHVSPPYFASAAARDAFYTTPALNDCSFRTDTGVIERYDGTAWRPEGVTRAAGPITTANSQGAVGDGATDATPFLQAADTKAVASGGWHEIDPDPSGSVFLVNSNCTLAAHFRPNTGAVLKIANGVTLTINGYFDPGLYRCFDTSLGGVVRINGVRSIRAEWLLHGDGVTDDLASWNAMLAAVPDYSDVYFGAKMQILTSGELLLSARRQVNLIFEGGNQPDGGGATILWNGFAHNVSGTDANITSGGFDLTTTTGKFSADMVGQRIIVAFAGPQSAGLMAKIQSYVSSTHVVLDTAASSTQTNREYIVGPAVLYLRSCDSCKVIRANVPIAAPGCRYGYDAYIASGTNTLNLAAFGQVQGSDVGKMIRVDGAGPGGTELITTISAVSGGVNGPQTITLAANASTTITSSQLTTYTVGRSATSLPARYGILSDESGVNGVTGTHCVFAENRITTPNPIDYDWYGIAISIATNQNQEYHIIEHNSILGGGTLELHGDGTAGATTTATSTTVTFPPGSIFSAAHTGRRIRIPGAGGSGIPLDCKIIQVVSGTQVTVSVAASASVTNARLFIGQGSSYGVVVGNSSNAKGIEMGRRNLLNSHKWGVWIRNGSLHAHTNSFTANEADYRIDGSTEPMLFTADNSEQSMRHLDNQGAGDPITFIAPRSGNDQTYPNGGFWNIDQNANEVIIISAKQDNDVPPDALMYKLVSSNNKLFLKHPHYHGTPTLAQLGISQTQLNNATAWVWVEGHDRILDAPANVFTMGWLNTDGGGTLSAGNLFSAQGGMSFGAPKNVGSNTTLDRWNSIVLVNIVGNTTVTLPAASYMTMHRLIRTDANASVLTIAPQSGTINGAASITIAGQWTAKTFVSDGTNWYAF